MAEIIPELDLPIGDHHYRLTRMSAFDQMTVASEYRDILIGLNMLRAERPKDMTDKDYDQATMFMIMSRGGVSEVTRHRIANICFSKVTRRSGAGYVPILPAQNQFQFADIGLPEMAKLLYATFELNKLLDFFGESPSDSGQTTTEVNGQ